ncbi:8620_t:CDS:2, partial [Acaulospora morrowiae]
SKIIEKMQNEIAMSSAENIGRRKVVVLSKPIGPHKMEAAILACFGTKDGVGLDNNGSVSSPPQMLHSAPYDEIQHYHDNASSEDTSSPLETPILERTDPFDNVSSYSHFRTIPLFRSTTMPNIPPSTSPPPFAEKFLAIPNPRQQSSPGLSTSVPEMNGFPVPSIPQRIDPRGPRILVVEDNAVNRMIISNFLKKRGIYFEEAENGAIGVEKYRKALEREEIDIDLKKGFDIIFMDIQMPVMNGNVATSEIRRIEKEYNERKGKLKKKTITEAIREFKVIPATTTFLLNSLSSAGFPSSLLNGESVNTEDNTTDPSTSTQNRSLIFALTGLASDEDKYVAFESGVDGFLTKPVSLKTLDKVIKRWHELEEFATQIPADTISSSMDTLNKDRIENEQETKDGKKEAQEQEEFRKKGIVSMCNC